MGRLLTRELKSCKHAVVSDCGLTLSTVTNLEGNPAGTSKSDEQNPFYKGKVSTKNGKLIISLNYILTGHIPRAEAGLKNIRNLYTKAGAIVDLKPNPSKFDLRIHGANLAELTQGLGLCDCQAALYIGGWAPAPKHYKWGNSLLLNPHQPSSTWPLTDAHEFGHKLGLKHRLDGGMMDYPPKRGKDMRTITSSDIKRIIDLYNSGK